MHSFLKFNPFSSSPQTLSNPFSLYTAIIDNEKNLCIWIFSLEFIIPPHYSYLVTLIFPEAHKIIKLILHFF